MSFNNIEINCLVKHNLIFSLLKDQAVLFWCSGAPESKMMEISIIFSVVFPLPQSQFFHHPSPIISTAREFRPVVLCSLWHKTRSDTASKADDGPRGC